MAKMMTIPSTTVNQGHFARVPAIDAPRSQFNRSNGFKTTFNAGDLVPCFVDEVLPGDTFNLRMTAFARLSTPLTPFMDNLHLDTFFFFVPCRLVWNNWEKFNGQQENPGDSTSFLVPQQVSPAGGYAIGSLQDYLGLPTQKAGYTHNALPLRAYNLIWNQWFRDQNLQNSVTVDKGDGPDTVTNYTLLKRGKRHDYFTSALPWPQKGPSVSLPLGTTAPIVLNTADTTSRVKIKTLANAQGPHAALWSLDDANTDGDLGTAAGFPNLLKIDPNGTLLANLSSATAATINQLRQAFQIQKTYERDARGGTRYTEIIQAHFGVVSDDARLQRPEFLGGGSTPVIVNPIAQTSAATAQPTPQGNLAAIGTAVVNRHGFTKSFTEHGYIIGLMSVRADLNYQQGLDKMWSRNTRFDFYWPELSHIGEQAVLNKEIYCQGTAGGTADDAAFGYQERYAEYRYKPSKITGQFRSSAAQTLDMWHLAQNFTSLPALNATFIQDNPPVDRVLAVPTQPDFLLDAFFDLKCARPMPVYSVPGLIDHF